MPRPAAHSETRPRPARAECAGCGIEADQRFTVAEHWTWWSNGPGELVPYCPTCAEQEFGHRTALTSGN